MPLLCKDMVDLLENSNASSANHSSLSNYAFLYGIFPTAPSVGIYAVYYNAELEVVSSLYLPFNNLPAVQILYCFLCAIQCLCFFFFSFSIWVCIVIGHRWDGDRHFSLSSNNVCFCLVTHHLLDGSSVCDEFTAECQL